MFIGKEGAVYSVLPVSAEENLTYTEAVSQENAIGFQLQRGRYHAVTYHGGKWVYSHPLDLEDYYDAQVAEWLNSGMGIPWQHRFEYFRVFLRCSRSYHSQFGQRFY